MQVFVNTSSPTSWPIAADACDDGPSDEMGLLVELRNYAQLLAIHGRDIAIRTLQYLRLRLLQWGAEVDEPEGGCLIARLRPQVLYWLQGDNDIDDESRDVPHWLEHLQLLLSNDVLYVGGRQLLPMVVVRQVVSFERTRARPWSCDPERTRRIVRASTLPAPARDDHDHERDMRIALRWHAALAQGRVGLVSQPVRHGATGRDLYGETLLRVRDGADDAGARALGPGELVPALERLGLVRLLDRLVMSTVLDRLEADRAARLGCNLSALSLVLDGWWGRPLQRLRARPDVAARLTVEVTETMPVTDEIAAVDFLRRLGRLGCRIALDDVGCGHSTLGLARELRPQVIKIAAPLVQEARDTPGAAAVLERLVDRCRGLASELVFEGIEREQDAALARRHGVDWLQGYAIARPAPLEPPLTVRPEPGREVFHV